MTESKYLRFMVRLGSVLLAVISAWLLFAYALPWLLPFIFAMLTARLLERILYLKGGSGSGAASARLYAQYSWSAVS